MLWQILRLVTFDYMVKLGKEYIEQAKIDYQRLRSFTHWIKENLNG